VIGPLGWRAILIGYVALSLGILAVAYAGAGARVLLKRESGRRSILAWPLLGPYLLLNLATFRIYRLLSREPAYVMVAPNLFFGRRLSAGERDGGWTSVLDLAGEFAAPPAHRDLSGYRSLPILDATAPTDQELRSAVDWIAEAVRSGPVYVHCALGHGRSACVIIAYLRSTGSIGDVDEGIRYLQSLRPGVRLHPRQIQAIRRLDLPRD
jgi:hypothetical protein